VLILFDSSRKETQEDLKLLKKHKKHKRLILLFNKMDLSSKMNKEKIKNQVKDLPCLEISALKKTNLDKLKEMIHQTFVPDVDFGGEVVLHLRQKLALEETLDCLETGRILLQQGYSEEICAEEIRKSIPLIGHLTGEIKVDDIMEDIFNRFCVGK